MASHEETSPKTSSEPVANVDSAPDQKSEFINNEKDLDKDLEKDDTSASATPADEEELEDPRPGAKAGLSVAQFWIILVGLNLGMLLAALDLNIVSTAVPTISSDFHDFKRSAWISSGFWISYALVLPIYPKLSDIFGRRKLFVLGTLIFILGSGLCGGAKSMNMLIWARVIQGLGGGGIYGLVNVIFTDLVPLREVGKYMQSTGVVWLIADAGGPLIGGAFSQYVTWRWNFWINLFISPITLVIAIFYLKLKKPDISSLRAKIAQVDYLGIITLAGSTVCLLLAIQWGGNTFPWSDRRVIACFVTSPVLFALFVFIEFKYAKDPYIPPSSMTNRTLLAIYGAEFCYGANVVGMLYYIPQFSQVVFGDSATISGLGLIPIMLGIIIGSPVAATVTSKYGRSKINGLVGGVIAALASGLIVRFGTGTSRAEAIILELILGIGFGALLSGLLLTAQVAVKEEEVGIITGVVIFVQTVGNIFGVAIFSAVFINKLTSGLVNIPGLTPADAALVLSDVRTIRHKFDGEIEKQIIKLYADSLRNGWWFLFACSLGSIAFTLMAKQHSFAKTK